MVTFQEFCFMKLFLRENGTIAQAYGFFIVLIRDTQDCTCRSVSLHCLNLLFNMAKPRKKVGRPPKKVPKGGRIQKPVQSRHRYTLSTKKKAIELHEGGMSLKNIQQWFRDNENTEMKRTTICTFYNPRNRTKMNEMGDLDGNNNDTCINIKQRPHIIVDLEQVLNIHVKRSQENGLPLTLQAASIAAVQL